AKHPGEEVRKRGRHKRGRPRKPIERRAETVAKSNGSSYPAHLPSELGKVVFRRNGLGKDAGDKDKPYRESGQHDNRKPDSRRFLAKPHGNTAEESSWLCRSGFASAGEHNLRCDFQSVSWTSTPAGGQPEKRASPRHLWN